MNCPALVTSCKSRSCFVMNSETHQKRETSIIRKQEKTTFLVVWKQMLQKLKLSFSFITPRKKKHLFKVFFSKFLQMSKLQKFDERDLFFLPTEALAWFCFLEKTFQSGRRHFVHHDVRLLLPHSVEVTMLFNQSHHLVSLVGARTQL